MAYTGLPDEVHIKRAEMLYQSVYNVPRTQLTLAQIAESLGLSQTAAVNEITHLIRLGILEAEQVGGRRFFYLMPKDAE